MAYVPDRGDIIWLNFHPQAGHEVEFICQIPQTILQRVLQKLHTLL